MTSGHNLMTSGKDGKKLTIKLQIASGLMEKCRVILKGAKSGVAVHAQHSPFLTGGVVFVIWMKSSSSA